MAKHDEWVSAGANRWMQMEAEHNARWAQLAYLDGPGYNIMDRIEAKMDLRRQYFSRSASHGVENSIPKPPTQVCTSQLISSMVESKQHNSRMAESAREIRESCARILKLLQEEIAESESGEVSLSDAIEFSPSATQIEAASTNNDDVDDDSLDLSASNVVLAEEIDASESLMMALYVSEDSLPSTNLMDTNSVAHQNAALLFLPKQIEVPRYTKRNPITAVFTDCNVVEDSSIISNYIAEVIEKSVYDHPIAKYPVSPPQPKPPDRSVQSMTIGFHSKWNHTMPRPPPHPPDANHRAEDSIIPFSCLERAVCTPPVWKNVSVNAHGDILALLCNCIMLRNLVGSKNIQRFMVEEGLVSTLAELHRAQGVQVNPLNS